MKLILMSLALVALVIGCTGTPEEIAAKRALVVDLAVDRIERFNAMGVDPIQLDPVKLLMLDTACVVAMIGGIEFGLEEEKLKTISAACDVIQKAAAKGTGPEA